MIIALSPTPTNRDGTEIDGMPALKECILHALDKAVTLDKGQYIQPTREEMDARGSLADRVFASNGQIELTTTELTLIEDCIRLNSLPVRSIHILRCLHKPALVAVPDAPPEVLPLPEQEPE